VNTRPELRSRHHRPSNPRALSHRDTSCRNGRSGRPGGYVLSADGRAFRAQCGMGALRARRHDGRQSAGSHRLLGPPRSHQSTGACSLTALAVISVLPRLQNFHSSLAAREYWKRTWSTSKASSCPWPWTSQGYAGGMPGRARHCSAPPGGSGVDLEEVRGRWRSGRWESRPAGKAKVGPAFDAQASRSAATVGRSAACGLVQLAALAFPSHAVPGWPGPAPFDTRDPPRPSPDPFGSVGDTSAMARPQGVGSRGGGRGPMAAIAPRPTDLDVRCMPNKGGIGS
jgi:hypothetical protein